MEQIILHRLIWWCRAFGHQAIYWATGQAGVKPPSIALARDGRFHYQLNPLGDSAWVLAPNLVALALVLHWRQLRSNVTLRSPTSSRQGNLRVVSREIGNYQGNAHHCELCALSSAFNSSAPRRAILFTPALNCFGCPIAPVHDWCYQDRSGFHNNKKLT